MINLSSTQDNHEKNIDQLLVEVFKGNFDEFRDYLAKHKMTELNLEGKELGKNKKNDLGLLSKALQGTGITAVNLSFNCMDGTEAAKFSKNLTGTNVGDLDLSYNEIGPKHNCVEFVKNLKGSKVNGLNVTGNDLGDIGSTYLAIGLRGSNVTTLNLDRNEIGDNGMTFVMLNLKGTKVNDLSLQHNKIASKGVNDSVKYLNGTALRKVALRENKNIENNALENFETLVANKKRDWEDSFILPLMVSKRKLDMPHTSKSTDPLLKGAEILANVPKDLQPNILQYFPGYTAYMGSVVGVKKKENLTKLTRQELLVAMIEKRNSSLLPTNI